MKDKITNILREWWMKESTCSGKPHCSVEHCDLCTNCLFELCDMLRIKGEDIIRIKS